MRVSAVESTQRWSIAQVTPEHAAKPHAEHRAEAIEHGTRASAVESLRDDRSHKRRQSAQLNLMLRITPPRASTANERARSAGHRAAASEHGERMRVVGRTSEGRAPKRRQATQLTHYAGHRADAGEHVTRVSAVESPRDD